MKIMNNAIILLSGGLDSVVSLACVKNNYDKIFALTFDYNQKSVKEEIKSSVNIAEFYGINHKIIKLDWLGNISTSALNNEIKIPTIKEDELKNREITKNTAKAVWVPNRNALFINIAGSFAEAGNYKDIIIGANKEEGETFIDNSINFIKAINESLKYSVNKEIEVKAPLIEMSKEEIVKKGIELNIPFNLIYSCYNGEGRHCSRCESCLRLKLALKKCKRIDIIESIFG